MPTDDQESKKGINFIRIASAASDGRASSTARSTTSSSSSSDAPSPNGPPTINGVPAAAAAAAAAAVAAASSSSNQRTGGQPLRGHRVPSSSSTRGRNSPTITPQFNADGLQFAPNSNGSSSTTVTTPTIDEHSSSGTITKQNSTSSSSSINTVKRPPPVRRQPVSLSTASSAESLGSRYRSRSGSLSQQQPQQYGSTGNIPRAATTSIVDSSSTSFLRSSNSRPSLSISAATKNLFSRSLKSPKSPLVSNHHHHYNHAPPTPSLMSPGTGADPNASTTSINAPPIPNLNAVQSSVNGSGGQSPVAGFVSTRRSFSERPSILGGTGSGTPGGGGPINSSGGGSARSSRDLERSSTFSSTASLAAASAAVNNSSNNTQGFESSETTLVPDDKKHSSGRHHILLRHPRKEVLSSSASNSVVAADGGSIYSFQPSPSSPSLTGRGGSGLQKSLSALDLRTSFSGRDRESERTSEAPEDSWSIFCLKLMPLFSKDGLIVPVEDLNVFVRQHIQYRKSEHPSVLLGDISDLLRECLSVLDVSVQSLPDEQLITSLVELWHFFYTGILPYWEAVFMPIQQEFSGYGTIFTTPEEAMEYWSKLGEGGKDMINIRREALKEFRDCILIPLDARLRIIFVDLRPHFACASQVTPRAGELMQCIAILSSIRTNDEIEEMTRQLSTLLRKDWLDTVGGSGGGGGSRQSQTQISPI